MNNESISNCLEKLMVELMEKGIEIPPQIIEDLKSGRTIQNIYRTESTEHIPHAETEPYLQRAEMSLMILADTMIGKEYANEWQDRIGRAYAETETDAAPAVNYITGVPKGERWIRIKMAELMTSVEVDELLDQHNLSASLQNDGYLLVNGCKENITSFLKAVRQKVGKTGP